MKKCILSSIATLVIVAIAIISYLFIPTRYIFGDHANIYLSDGQIIRNVEIHKPQKTIKIESKSETHFNNSNIKEINFSLDLDYLKDLKFSQIQMVLGAEIPIWNNKSRKTLIVPFKMSEYKLHGNLIITK